MRQLGNQHTHQIERNRHCPCDREGIWQQLSHSSTVVLAHDGQGTSSSKIGLAEPFRDQWTVSSSMSFC